VTRAAHLVARPVVERHKAFAPWDPRHATGRITTALWMGTLAAWLLPRSLDIATRVVAGWNVGAIAMLGLAWIIIVRADPSETHRRASSLDPGRTVVWLLVLSSSTASLFSAAVLMRHAKTLGGGEETLLVALALCAVVTAWLLTHTSYTLRYAHLYYRECDGIGGLEFPGGTPPCDFDFAYFGFTVGMCFQVSDVVVTSPTIRRTVLGHSLLSFVYNTVIVALALNLVFGLMS
jgi:uncharacterized membrane protein